VNFIYGSKLFKQLTAVIGLLIVLAMGIPIAFSFFYITPKIVQDRYFQVMSNDVDFLSARLDWLLTKSIADVEYLSTKMELSDADKIKKAGENLDIFVKSSAIFTGGLVTDEKGIMLVFNTSPQGNIELKQKNDISNRDYISIPLTKGGPFLSDVIITQTSPLPVIFISCVVKENGKMTGVLASTINLWNENNIFYSLVQGFQEKKKGNIYVVDGHGTIVFHNHKEMAGQSVNPAILAQTTGRREGIIEKFEGANGEIALAFSKMQINNWVVIYEISHREIYAMANISAILTIGTMILVLILGFLASILFTRIILRPLAEITAATEQVAAGDLTQQITSEGHNDFSKLIENFNIMTANLRTQYQELEKISLQDYLTGLANRRYFEQQLKLELERARRMKHSSTIMMLDIDDFKKINDKFGHLEGDRALKALASELKQSLREADLAARFGGEEFIVLLAETSLEQGLIIAEKIRERISKIDLNSRKGSITFTVSIGMAGTEQESGLGYDCIDNACRKLIARADKALYEAKRKGKNRTELN